jgi:hypothetical protein
MLCITPSLHISRLAPSNEKYGFADTSYTVDTTLDMLTTGNGGAPNAHLQRLELRTIISGHDLDKIGSLTNLRSLRVTGIKPETQGGFEGSAYLQRLSRLPYLQELLLSLEENETFLPVVEGSDDTPVDFPLPRDFPQNSQYGCISMGYRLLFTPHTFLV